MTNQPGPELDRRIDEVLFGRTFTEFPMGWCYFTEGRGWRRAEPYSTTWNGMQLVVEEMQRRGMTVRIEIEPHVVTADVSVINLQDGWHRVYREIETTAPHAVCKAVLGAISALEGQRDET